MWSSSPAEEEHQTDSSCMGARPLSGRSSHYPTPLAKATRTGTASAIKCNNCFGAGHLKRNCPQIRCNGCGETGHFKQDCPAAASKRRRCSEDGSAIASDGNHHRSSHTISGGSGMMLTGSMDAEDEYTGGNNPNNSNNNNSNANANITNTGATSYQNEVCHRCGSSRHIQASCPVPLLVECRQCHQEGHVMTICPQTRCFNCGSMGHSAQICQSKTHCFHCSVQGHRSSECPIKSRGRVCYQCKEPGHEAAKCPQGIVCRMCHQQGHVIAHCPSIKCNACHQKGHMAGDCQSTTSPNLGPVPASSVSPGVLPSTALPPSSSSSSSSPPPPVLSSLGGSVAVNGQPPPTALIPSSTASEEEAVTTAAPPVSLVPHQPPLVRGPTAVPRLPGGGGGSSRAAPAAGAATGTGFTDPSSGILKPPLPALVPYEPISTVAMRRGRVVVVIDGPYFERCVRGHENKCVEQYQRTTFALQQALAYIGDLFQMEPIAYWFDTGHEAFTEFLETAMPLHCREAAFRDAAQRRQYLIDEMNSTTGKLSYVVARLVGSMKRQRGYTPDGPGHVWVQSGVDVAMATCLMEHFQDPRLQGCQVVLLSGDSDLYPAVQYCNNLRRGLGLSRVGNPAPQQIGEDGAGNGDQSPLDYTMASSSSASTTAAAAATGVPPPVRMCGTSKSLSKRYGLDQDLFEFLPRILLDEASHTERGQPFQFASHVLFD